MSLNIHKAKTINNLISNFSKPKRSENNRQKSSKIGHKDFIKKEGLLDYLQSFLTPRRPILIKQNFLLTKNKINKNYLSTIQTKNDVRSPSNNSKINKSNSIDKSIFDSNSNIIYRNSNRINQINSLKYKINLKQIFSSTINQNDYSKKFSGFSPRNRFRLMKIYQSLKCINPPCITKESNSDSNAKNKHFNSEELNLAQKNESKIENKEKNNKYNIKKNNNCIIENVNSLQILSDKKNILKKNNLYLEEKKETETEIYNNINKINNYFSENNIIHENKKEKIIDDKKNNIKMEISPIKNHIVVFDNVKNSKAKTIKKENNYKNKEVYKKDILRDFDKYNKKNIMENCLNKLFFDYSDGNYLNPNNYKYLNDDNEDSNIIIKKEIVNKKEEKDEKLELEDKYNNLLDEQTINNNNNLNQIPKNSQIKIIDNIENKENINTENLKNNKDKLLSSNNENINNSINNIKDKNNQKMKQLIYDKICDENNLNEDNKINLNLNYLYENKNYVNIQLLNDPINNNNTTRKKNFPSNTNVFKPSKLLKKPKTNLELLLDRIPKHDNENENDLNNIHSMKQSKSNHKNLRRSKIIEFINKNSAIMPPNDYNASSQLVYSF